MDCPHFCYIWYFNSVGSLAENPLITRFCMETVSISEDSRMRETHKLYECGRLLDICTLYHCASCSLEPVSLVQGLSTTNTCKGAINLSDDFNTEENERNRVQMRAKG